MGRPLLPKGRVNTSKLDQTSERDIARHQLEDDLEAMADAAKFAREYGVELV